MANTAIDTSNYVYLCVTGNYWGKGKTPEDAKRFCRQAGGSHASEQIKKLGYRIYYLHPDFELAETCMGLEIYTPIFHPVETVEVKDLTKRDHAKRGLRFRR